MSSKPTILITGATGHLGHAVTEAFLERGATVVATDRRFVSGFPTRLVVGDLLDEGFVYRLVEGCNAVVHLANHPNIHAGPSPQQLLSDNVAMNTNVFFASMHLGVERLVFSSSVQVMLRYNGQRREPPFQLPYLPLDGAAPRNPGTNPYALSKEFAERTLEALAEEHPSASITAIRFPMLPREGWVSHLLSQVQRLPGWLNFGECLTYLRLPDAASLVVRVVERSRPGYHQLFPARSMEIEGMTATLLRERYFAHVPLRCPKEEFRDFVDLGQLREDWDWVPELGLRIRAEWDS